jgi:multidrug resistance efflux pump
VTVVAVGATAALVGCSKGVVTSSPADLRVYRGPLVQRHLLSGELEAVERAEIKVPRTREHRLQIQWLVADGSMVEEGETVLQFDNSSFAANLDQQRTALQRSRRTLLQTLAGGEARLREAEAVVQRARIALAKAELDAAVPEAIRSRYDYRTLELAAAKARADHRKAEADLLATTTAVDSENRIAEEQHRKAERELEVAEEALDALSLAAPRAGIIVVDEHPWEDRKYQIGDTAFPGWTVLGIPNLERLRVRASLSDVDDGLLEVGMAAECNPDIEPGLHLRGRITEITPIAREQRIFSQRRGFDVTVDLDEDPGEVLLVPGMSVRVDVSHSSEREHLLVPRAALDLDGPSPRARRRGGSWAEVEIGACSVHDCILIDGLSEGDRLGAVAGTES